MKGCALSAISSRPQPAAVRLHNGTADGQPHATALRLGGKERRKDLIHLLHWQPHARVADRELELTVLQFRLPVSSPPESVMASMALSMRFMNTCCSCTRSTMILGVGGQFGAHSNRVSSGLTFQQRQHFVDNSVYVDQLTLWRRLLVERTYTVDDFSRT